MIGASWLESDSCSLSLEVQKWLYFTLKQCDSEFTNITEIIVYSFALMSQYIIFLKYIFLIILSPRKWMTTSQNFAFYIMILYGTGVTTMVSDFTNGKPGVFCKTKTINLVVASPLSDPIFFGSQWVFINRKLNDF